MRRAAVAAIWCVAAVARPGLALDPSRLLTQFALDLHSTETGLPQSSGEAIVQTRDGYLWIGTQEGLARYDGAEFFVFDKRNTPALRHNRVLALFEDSRGSLWIGTEGGGAARLTNGVFAPFGVADGLAPSVRAFVEDASHVLWAATGDALARFDGTRWTRVPTAPSGEVEGVNALAAAPDGSLWVGTRAGLRRFVNGRVAADPLPAALGTTRIRSLRPGRDGTLWVGTRTGLTRLRPGAGSSFEAEELLPQHDVAVLLEDRDGSLWIGSDHGLSRLAAGSLATLTTREGLSNDVILSLCEDREGSLWVGTQDGGVVRLRQGPFTPWSKAEGLSGEIASPIVEGADGSLWIGTRDGGLSRLRDGRVTSYRAADGLGDDFVQALLAEADGGLFVGTRSGGVVRLFGGRFESYTERLGLTTRHVRSLARARDGSLWVGTSGGGLYRYKDGVSTRYDKANGLPHESIFFLLEDRAGRILAATNGGGLAIWDGRAFTALTTKDGLGADIVNTLHEDAEGTLFIGTYGGGLSRLKGGRLFTFTAKDGLFDDAVFRILEDARGNLWISCNKGVYRIAKSELEAFASGRPRALQPKAFGTLDGMRSAECNGADQPTGWKTRDGRLWFPTVKGVVVVDPERLGKNETPPPVVVQRLRADGVDVPLAPSVALKAGTLSVEFDYAALTFLAPSRVKFRHRLDGFDAGWIEGGGRRTTTYTNLAPGSYLFHVAACNADGVWNERGASLAFSIAPFFHQTLAFKLFVGLALLGAAAAAHRYRLVKAERRQRELEVLVHRRTRQLQEKTKRLAEAEARIGDLVASAPNALADLPTWSRRAAEEIARAVGVESIRVFAPDDAPVSSVTDSDARRLALDAATRVAPPPEAAEAGETVLPILGMTGARIGALVVRGSTEGWGESERRLVRAFARQLGDALELVRLRRDLAANERKKAEARQELLDRGIDVLQLCTVCGTAYDQTAARCEREGAALASGRLLPYRVQGRFRLTRLLAEGGMGSILEAVDEKLDREVAVKIVRGDHFEDVSLRIRFEREARLAASVKHPGVVAIHDTGDLPDGSAFLVMERLHGCDLEQALRRFGRGTPRQVAAVLRQGAAALGAAHRVGLVHRDVKPANLFLSNAAEPFQVKVLDFGLAKPMSQEDGLTRSGILVGTPQYMSPEQVRGREVDARSDVYSFAAVAYEALTGARVVKAVDFGPICVEVLKETPPPPSTHLAGLPPEVDAAFAAAFAKDALSRPDDVEAWVASFVVRLEALESDSLGWYVPGAPPAGR